MNLESLDPDSVEDVFAQHGALAITLRDAGDDPVLEPQPGETPLWTDTCITGLFAAKQNLEPLMIALKERFELSTLPAWRMEDLADRVWEREWMRDFQPMRFGRRLMVLPKDYAAPDTDTIVIRLDPGLAFGTGTHPTTSLCLEWLDGLELARQRILDFGCGSGILAIGALLCGASRAVGVDIDPQAITASRENARVNSVADRLTLTLDNADAQGPFDVLVANILAGPLIELAPALLGKLRPGGRFALSGILENQIDAVSAAFQAGTTLAPPAIADGWVRLSGEKL